MSALAGRPVGGRTVPADTDQTEAGSHRLKDRTYHRRSGRGRSVWHTVIHETV